MGEAGRWCGHLACGMGGLLGQGNGEWGLTTNGHEWARMGTNGEGTGKGENC